MTGEVIKSFLVGLGFGVDETSLAKFNKAISSAATRVTALYATIKVAAAGIFWGISKISEGFEQMGYEYRIIAPMINKTLMLRQALLSAYKAAGINITKTVQQSVLFNFSLAKTKFALDAIYKSVGVKFLPMLTKQMDVFRTKIYANMPRIQGALEKFVKFIFKAFEATVILGNRVWSMLGRAYDFFKQLDAATDGWSTRILGAIAVWKLLNLTFLTTPFGMILAGLTAILAIYDDFKTYQEGGESLFNWGEMVPIINTAKVALSGLLDTWRSFVDVVLDLVLAVQQLWQGDMDGFLDSIKRAASDATAIFQHLWESIKDIITGTGAFIGLIAEKLSGLFGSQKAAAAAGSALNTFGGAGAAPALAGAAQPQPLMPGNSGVNQKISQQTSITVQGSPDASSTGRAVAGEQSRVNFDMARNMKGATR